MRFILFICLFLLIGLSANAQSSDCDTLTHTAKYDGKDLLVKNSMDSKHGYSIKEVLLNGKVLRDPISAGTYTIKLTNAGLSKDEEYTIKIAYYKSSQKPQILGTK